MWFHIVCSLFFFTYAECSHLKIYFPPSQYGNFPRIRLNDRFPSLSEFTFCTWLKPHAFQKEYSTFFSYATHQSDNEFAGCLSKKDGLVKVGINLPKHYLEIECPRVNWQNGEWYHLCASWFSSTGLLKVYVNGRKCNDNSVISAGARIQEGGIFVLGQDQDELDGKYDGSQAWHGDVADFNLWNEVLTEQQILEAAKCNKKRKEGNVISRLKTPMTAIHVVISETELCLP